MTESRPARPVGRMLVPVALAIGACASAPESPAPDATDGAARFRVDSTIPWNPTGLVVDARERIEIFAAGEIRSVQHGPFGWNGSDYVDPRGTYVWYQGESEAGAPLAAGAFGPAPACALIGRIGDDGQPFLVGEHAVIEAPAAGELQLGCNDVDLSDNSGAFDVAVVLGGDAPDTAAPVDERAILDAPSAPRVAEDSHVLVIFVDGLRPDVLREMAFHGYLPNFRRIFFDGGTDIERTFTISPSNTIPATTACFTGSWPDRTGLVAQLIFHRKNGSLESLLDALGPAHTASLIDAEWWNTPSASGRERPRFLTEWCDDSEAPYATTVLPVLPGHPPDLYVQRLANVVPLFRAHELRRTYADRVQTAFALERVIRKENRVMAIWYSGVDAAAHATARGLFGEARRELALIDEDLGKLEAGLVEQGIADKTYWVLFADHGSVGGDHFVSRNYDIANDFFFSSIVDVDRNRKPDLAGGLGMNVRFEVGEVVVGRTHEDLAPEHFAVCATQAYAATSIALPKGSFLSGDWSAPNTLDELRHYQVHPSFASVDVPSRLLAITRTRDAQEAGIPIHPIAFVAVPLPLQSAVLVLGQEGRAALLERRKLNGAPGRRFEYRYRPLRSWDVDGDGVTGETTIEPGRDPYLYFGTEPFASRMREDPSWIDRWRDDREWLELTADSGYPDAVVGMTHMLLDDPEDARFDPDERCDFYVIAARGWNFETGRVAPATQHGAPDYECMHIPFMVAGPGIPQGARVRRPARIIDVLPTVLDLARIEYDESEFDGRPVREIWGLPVPPEPPESGTRATVPFTTDHGLPLPPRDTRVEHESLIHDPQEWYDLHNVATNVSAVMLQEIVHLVDGPIDVVTPGPDVAPLGNTLDFTAESWSELPDSKFATRPAELVEALRLRHITIGELINPIQSLQHIDRAVGVVRWAQEVVKDPVRPLGDGALLAYYPIDKTCDGVVWCVLAVRDVVERGLIAIVDGTIDGVESGVALGVNAAFDDGPTPTPRVRVVHPTPRRGSD